MTIHEFGKENKRTVVLIHPSLVKWDYFERVIPLLERKYHVIIPALPGYDPDVKSDFTSVEEIAAALEQWLILNCYGGVDCVYGCSMGGAVVVRMLADDKLNIGSAVIDGGITPYQLPWLFTRFIAVKDFLMINIGKFGGLKTLEKAFAADEYSQEDLKYIADVLHMISEKTIWRTFDSCNNYPMPETVVTSCKRIEYWLAENEIKERKWDIRYIRKTFPQARFLCVKNIGHAGLALLRPKAFARGIYRIITHNGA